MPNTLANAIGTVACCRTTMAFAESGPVHDTPVLARHFNCGQPGVIDATILALAFALPAAALKLRAVISALPTCAVQQLMSAAPASAAGVGRRLQRAPGDHGIAEIDDECR